MYQNREEICHTLLISGANLSSSEIIIPLSSGRSGKWKRKLGHQTRKGTIENSHLSRAQSWPRPKIPEPHPRRFSQPYSKNHDPSASGVEYERGHLLPQREPIPVVLFYLISTVRINRLTIQHPINPNGQFSSPVQLFEELDIVNRQTSIVH